MAKQYRVVSKRTGCRTKAVEYARRSSALRRMTLFGPEPWKAWGQEPDELMCCPGNMCGCGGVTNREQHEAIRENMPRLEWIRLEVREVGPWEVDPEPAPE